MTLHSQPENSLAVLNHKILEANSQVQNVKLGGHQTCLSINRLWHELCDMLRRLVRTTAPDIMIVHFRNEKQTDLEPEGLLSGSGQASTQTVISDASKVNQPKRLHVSNIPFRFRDPDLRQLFGKTAAEAIYVGHMQKQFRQIFRSRNYSTEVNTLCEKVISEELLISAEDNILIVSNGALFSSLREYKDCSIAATRRLQVNNATARVQTKKLPSIPNGKAKTTIDEMAALRGVALQRGRARGAFATAFARHPSPLTAAAAATALHGYTPLMLHRGVYQDPFLAYAGAAAERYQLPVGFYSIFVRRKYGDKKRFSSNEAKCTNKVLQKSPNTANFGVADEIRRIFLAPASYAASAAYTAAAARSYAAAAAAAQPVASYAAIAGSPSLYYSYGREYADPYLGHSIGPVAGYGNADDNRVYLQQAAVYRSGYSRFAPY
ncbi:putative rna-binding protein [Trichonephila clavipes]|nr:putative rna-binding protein [Trichonephila clavipes]